jgi:hypothetical protein
VIIKKGNVSPDRPAENPQKAKAVPNPILPPLTQEPLLHLDATPDSDYPLRILRAYRENCNCRWIANPPSALCDAMNEAQEKRAKLLDRAIAILEKELGR